MAIKYPTRKDAKKMDPPNFNGPIGSVLESSVAEYQVSQPFMGDVLDHWISVLQALGVKSSSKAGNALLQVREALRVGMPRSVFDSLKNDLGISSEEFAAVLGIPVRTLARRIDRFKPDESERLLRVGSVLKRAHDVLENKDSVRRWMTQPKRDLGGLTPLVCCDSEMGAREVEALLGRIEHGVFS